MHSKQYIMMRILTDIESQRLERDIRNIQEMKVPLNMAITKIIRKDTVSVTGNKEEEGMSIIPPMQNMVRHSHKNLKWKDVNSFTLSFID